MSRHVHGDPELLDELAEAKKLIAGFEEAVENAASGDSYVKLSGWLKIARACQSNAETRLQTFMERGRDNPSVYRRSEW